MGVSVVVDRSRIEWTDRTWNPVTGCTKVSPGCDHCYAESIAHRFAGSSPRPSREPRRALRTARAAAPVPRKLLADYVAEARAAWTPGVVVSPAWVRQVTDCSRGLSPKVAAVLTAEHDTPNSTTGPVTTTGPAPERTAA